MKYITLCLILLTITCPGAAFAKIVVIGNGDIGSLSNDTILRIYTGRVIEVNGISVTPVNVRPNSKNRNLFLKTYLNQDEDKYSAYWTVRRFIGKGTPPVELKNDEEVLRFVMEKKGAIGYVDDKNVEIPGTVNILSN